VFWHWFLEGEAPAELFTIKAYSRLGGSLAL